MFKWYSCPKSIKDPHIIRVLKYYNYWKASEHVMYPDGKGPYEQPSKLLSAFEHIAAVNKWLKERNKKNGKQS
jgi:hypothetical protein